MVRQTRIHVPDDKVAAFCRRHRIRRLLWFGSVLREDFGPDSDVDVLVEFEPDGGPGFIGLSLMQEELGALLGGRRVDMVTINALNHRIRDRILAEVLVQYGEG